MEQIFKFGSVSSAAKAKRLLADSKIRGRLTKTDDASDGCSWGIAVYGADAEKATGVLRRHGLRYEIL